MNRPVYIRAYRPSAVAPCERPHKAKPPKPIVSARVRELAAANNFSVAEVLLIRRDLVGV